MAADLEKALLQTHKDLIDAIFHRGNDPRNRLLDLMSPKLHGCGTARHETIQSIDDYLSIFDGEINELPVGLVDRPVNLRTTIIENVGIVHGAYELLFKIENQNTSMYVRLTVVYEHRNKKWQAIHLHGSEPSAHIAEGETWPAEALKAQNEELQKTITEKTADLEQKNKNLLIEVALEKVRSRTMAMHNSSELAETTEVLHQQLLDLGIHADRTTIAFPDETSGVAEFWSTNQGGVKIDHQFKADLTEPHQGLKTLAGWKRKLKSIVIRLEGEELRAFLDYYKEKVGLPIIVQITKKTKRDYTSAYFSHGWITLVTFEPLSHEKISILERFAAVFNLTYTRFLDLQKAEAQTREAKIEASLERVRSKAMSMHGSRDLADTISMFYHELELFSITPRRCGVGLLDRETQMAELSTMNTTEQGNSIEIIGKLKMADHPVLQGVFDHWILQKEYHPVLRGHEIKDYYQLVRPQIEFPDYPHDEEQFGYFFFFPEGGVYAWTDKELGENELKIYRRFTTVLSLTYKRYKDIKEAEAQAREAQIELGLERVRARAMAMQNSEELKELISTVFAELTKLDLVLTRCLIMIYDPKTKDSTWWMANSEAPSDSIGLFVQYHEQPPYLAYIKAWQQQNLKWQYILEGKVKKQWDDFLFNETELSDLPAMIISGMKAPGSVYLNASFNNFGNLTLASLEPLSNEQFDILLRFAKVFNLTYTRFNDLKQAEAQTREAKIEAALERVRSRTMAMHNSQDVGDTAIVIFDELEKLGVATNRCGISKFDDKGFMEVWTAGLGVNYAVRGRVDTRIHRMLTEGYKAWKKKDATFSYFLQGSDLIDYYTALENAPDYPYQVPETLPSAQAISLFYFPEGALYAFTAETLSNEAVQVFTRFAGVFALTYRRYLDLMIAEQQTRLAIQQSSLDRVRAEIASMRTTSDLERITPLIWNELTTLGVPFIRCGVFIMDEDDEQIHTFLSTPDGKAIAAFKLPFTTPGTSAQALAYWRKKEIFTDHWDEAAFKAWTANLVEQGLISSSEKYSSQHSPANLHLYFLPFLQGMLYVGSEVPLGDDEINVAQTLANAFSTAYSRFEDFNKLESAKQQIEKTLVDLKLAQSQLVQSEKMASLGELTAGIAHEIQNPLNFVNNFSEVSMELIEEVKSEKLKAKSERNEELENELLDDITENLQKISHHGKRADFIVKGMLQHSRTSTGEKQLTNINTLADEFLKLSYHGLRAKDKSFNAELITNFDKSLPQISVVQQDIGRVLLNLFNNAFYAVQEKRKAESPKQKGEYKPAVEVSTSIKDGFVVISIKDNGCGIPQAIKEKIMQPFFTTKPTGEGTGLGLSLSYDIVKAHGGNLDLESEEGKGSEFLIFLSLKP